MSASRIRNWDIALVKAVRPLIGRPFAWGETDCGALFRRTSSAMYGADIFAWLGTWDDEPSALRVLARWGSMAVALEKVGATAVSLTEAQSGDILLAAVVGEPHEVFGMAAVMVSGQICYVDVEHGVQCRAVPLTALADATVWRLPWTIEVHDG